MNHFPETTAALRRLARAIADLFKSREQLYAEMMQREGGIDRTSSPWWRVKDYEEAEEEGKPW